jgi:hypothetical protein
MAWAGQSSTHKGSPSQWLQLNAHPADRSTAIAPKGQAYTHALQAIHLSLSINRAPVFGHSYIALTGHTALQMGFTHFMQTTGMEMYVPSC